MLDNLCKHSLRFDPFIRHFLYPTFQVSYDSIVINDYYFFLFLMQSLRRATGRRYTTISMGQTSGLDEPTERGDWESLGVPVPHGQVQHRCWVRLPALEPEINKDETSGGRQERLLLYVTF